MRKVLVALAAVLTLSACGSDGTEVQVRNDDGVCSVVIQQNRVGNPDRDFTYPIPCTIEEGSSSVSD